MTIRETLKQFYQLHQQKEEFLSQIPPSLQDFIMNEFTEASVIQAETLMESILPEEVLDIFFDYIYNDRKSITIECPEGERGVLYEIDNFEDLLDFLEEECGIQ